MQQKKIKSLGNSNDTADQKTERNDDNTNEIGFATFLTKQIDRFMCFQSIMTSLLLPTDKYLFKVKSRNTIFIC